MNEANERPRRQSDDHRCFKQPTDRGALIWRYFDDWKFEDLISTGELHLCRVDRLGDKTEASRPLGDRALFDEAKEIIARRADGSLPIVQCGWEHSDEHARTAMFVSCWQLGTHDRMSMWERYCDDRARGLAVVSTYERLDRAVPLSIHDERHVMLGLVQYGDYDSETYRTDPSNVYSTVMSKQIGYDDEQEVRLVCDMFDGTGPGYVRTKVDLQNLIAEIVISPFASDEFLRHWQLRLEETGLSFPLRRSTLCDIRKVY